MGREKVVSFRATAWHVARLDEMRRDSVPDGRPGRSVSEVIRGAIALMWKQRSAFASRDERALSEGGCARCRYCPNINDAQVKNG